MNLGKDPQRVTFNANPRSKEIAPVEAIQKATMATIAFQNSTAKTVTDATKFDASDNSNSAARDIDMQQADSHSTTSDVEMQEADSDTESDATTSHSEWKNIKPSNDDNTFEQVALYHLMDDPEYRDFAKVNLLANTIIRSALRNMPSHEDDSSRSYFLSKMDLGIDELSDDGGEEKNDAAEEQEGSSGAMGEVNEGQSCSGFTTAPLTSQSANVSKQSMEESAQQARDITKLFGSRFQKEPRKRRQVGKWDPEFSFLMTKEQFDQENAKIIAENAGLAAEEAAAAEKKRARSKGKSEAKDLGPQARVDTSSPTPANSENHTDGLASDSLSVNLLNAQLAFIGFELKDIAYAAEQKYTAEMVQSILAAFHSGQGRDKAYDTMDAVLDANEIVYGGFDLDVIGATSLLISARAYSAPLEFVQRYADKNDLRSIYIVASNDEIEL